MTMNVAPTAAVPDGVHNNVYDNGDYDIAGAFDVVQFYVDIPVAPYADWMDNYWGEATNVGACVEPGYDTLDSNVGQHVAYAMSRRPINLTVPEEQLGPISSTYDMWVWWQPVPPLQVAYCLGWRHTAVYAATNSDSVTASQGAMNDISVVDEVPPAYGGVPAGQLLGGCDCDGDGSIDASAGVASDDSSANRPSAYRGDPVNTATGNFTESFGDLDLPGPGMPFHLGRTYNSSDGTSSVFGTGWSWTYGAKLTLGMSGTSPITYRAADGQSVVYSYGGGVWRARGSRSRITKVGSNYQLLTPSRTVYGFDSAGKLTSITPRNRPAISISYTGADATTITDSAGRSIALTYSSGLLTKAQLADGRYVQYTYSSGKLTDFRDLNGKHWTYGWGGSSGKLETITDPLSNASVSVTYSSTTGRVASQTDGRGKTSTFAWNAALGLSTMTDPRGKDWKDYYFKNVLIKSIDPDGHVTKYRYDIAWNVTRTTDARGNTTIMEYDERGNPTCEIRPGDLTCTRAWTYSDANLSTDVATHTDANGGETDYTYTGSGQVATITDPDNNVTTYTYNGSGQVATIDRPAWSYHDVRLQRDGRSDVDHDAAGEGHVDDL